MRLLVHSTSSLSSLFLVIILSLTTLLLPKTVLPVVYSWVNQDECDIITHDGCTDNEIRHIEKLKIFYHNDIDEMNNDLEKIKNLIVNLERIIMNMKGGEGLQQDDEDEDDEEQQQNFEYDEDEIYKKKQEILQLQEKYDIIVTLRDHVKDNPHEFDDPYTYFEKDADKDEL